MKTLKLAIVTLAIAASTSGASFAAAMDANGNIPNHNSDKLSAYTDNYNPGIQRTLRSNYRVSRTDRELLRLQEERDQLSSH